MALGQQRANSDAPEQRREPRGGSPLSLPISGIVVPARPDRVQIKISLRPAEYRQAQAAAKAAGLSSAGWVRALVRARLFAQPTLGAPVDVAMADALTELRRIAVALTHLAKTNGEAAGGQVETLAAEAQCANQTLHAVLAGNLRDLGHESL